jgi:hypothetical protein
MWPPFQAACFLVNGFTGLIELLGTGVRQVTAVQAKPFWFLNHKESRFESEPPLLTAWRKQSGQSAKSVSRLLSFDAEFGADATLRSNPFPKKSLFECEPPLLTAFRNQSDNSAESVPQLLSFDAARSRRSAPMKSVPPLTGH